MAWSTIAVFHIKGHRLSAQVDQGKVALVTGSASGLMRGVCVSLARRGYSIGANFRAPRTHCDETLQAVSAAAPQVHAAAFEADVSDAEAATRLVHSVHAALGGPHLLVCGAGPMIVKDAIASSAQDYAAMLHGNLGSVFFTVKAALPAMREQHFGRIITFGMTGSDNAMGFRHLSLYAAAKAAVVAFTRSVALEEAQHGITCNAIDVGDIRDKDAQRSDVLERRDYRNPTMRPGSWEDVGDAVAFLASPEASFVNGSVLTVNGGWQGFFAEYSRWP